MSVTNGREGFEILCGSCPFRKGNDDAVREWLDEDPRTRGQSVERTRIIAINQADMHGGFRCHSVDMLPIPEHPVCAGARAYLANKERSRLGPAPLSTSTNGNDATRKV